MGIILSKIKKPIIFDTKDIEINNTFDILFETDGKSNNEITAKIANYNNQDVLIHLYEGVIPVRDNEREVVNLYQVKPTYYTLKASCVSEILITIDIGKLNRKLYDKRIYLKFKYHDGIRKRKINYCK